MRVLVSGASGLVGGALVPALVADGHEVARLVRRAARAPDEIAWQPEREALDPAALAGRDAVVHLAGESIAAGRWTKARRAGIRNSRVATTRLLAETLTRSSAAPRILVCSSAVGYYGDRGDEVLTEASGPGHGFLADVVREWEAAAERAVHAGVRVVHLRQGMVLSARGGALTPLLRLFRAGLGGPLASGSQWVSWITLADLVDAIRRALADQGFEGAVNAVAPGSVRQRDFARTLGRALGRPAWFPAPALALRIVLGEMGKELLLFSQRVEPARLLAAGHSFRYPELSAALGGVLREDLPAAARA